MVSRSAERLLHLIVPLAAWLHPINDSAHHHHHLHPHVLVDIPNQVSSTVQPWSPLFPDEQGLIDFERG